MPFVWLMGSDRTPRETLNTEPGPVYPTHHARRTDDDQKRLFEKIKRGQFCFDEDAWGDISDEAKDLISCLLELDPAKRLTARAALRHPWVLVVRHLWDAIGRPRWGVVCSTRIDWSTDRSAPIK